MKTALFSLILLLGTSFSIKNTLTVSVVIHRSDDCDFIILYNNSGYIVAEHYSGDEFDEDTKVYGNINGYGYKDIYDEDLEDKEHIYIEDWGLSKEDAMELYIEKCD